MKLVSVIIPVFNSEKYLRRCLDSILSQDYNNIEVILVDDGSSDVSGTICDEYAETYTNVIVYHKKNQGASLARKYGLERAHGEYVCFVDSDDWVSPIYISKLYALLDKFHVNVSACSIQRLKVGENAQNNNINAYKSSLLPFEKLMPRFFKYEFWGFPGKIYLRSSLDNLTFPKATLSEDYYVMAQLFYKERQIAYTEEPLYYYEYHDNSLSHQKLSKKAFEEFENVKAVYDLIKEKELLFADFALANLVETCIKLSLMVHRSKEKETFQEEYSNINSFIKKHFWSIIKCNRLLWKTKYVITGLLSLPSITARILYNEKAHLYYNTLP